MEFGKNIFFIILSRIAETIKLIAIFIARLIYSVIMLIPFIVYSLITKYAYLLVIGFISMYYYLFYQAPFFSVKFEATQENIEYVDNLFSSFRVSNPSDQIILDIVNSSTTLLTFVISITLTFFIFSLREQKSMSPSAVYKSYRNNTFIFYILTISLTMISGFHLKYIYNANIDTENINSIAVTATHFGKFILWFILFFSTFIFLIYVILFLFRNMNLNWLLPNIISQTRDSFISLFLYFDIWIFKKLRKNEYTKLKFYFESIFQMLEYSAKNNMSKDFYDNIVKLRYILEELNNFHPLKKKEIKISFLNRVDENEFQDLYKSIIKSVLSLIVELFKNNKVNKGEEAIDLLFSLYSTQTSDELKYHFLQSLAELLQIVDLKNDTQVRAILSIIENMDKRDTLKLYQTFILRLIKENDVQLLTSVVYSQKRNAESTKEINSYKDKNRIVLNNLNQRYIKFNVAMLLKSAVKSIELSHYICTGFLVKFLVTNFTGQVLKDTLLELDKHMGDSDTFFETTDTVANRGYIDFYFNDETYDYCVKKLNILIFGQQKYAINNNLEFIKDYKNNQYEFIDIITPFEGCNYNNYIMTKVMTCSDKYGLLFLKDKIFVKQLLKEFDTKLLTECENR